MLGRKDLRHAHARVCDLPERQRLPERPDLRHLDDLPRRCVHRGRLHHDGRLFESRARFERRLPTIHRYLREWGAEGFQEFLEVKAVLGAA